MSTTYTWPGWAVTRFEARVMPNLRTFVGPYTPYTQVLDFMGERWSFRVDLAPTVDPIEGAAREAFFDRLKGAANYVSLWHQKLLAPQGTMRDGVTGSVVNGSLAAVSVVNGSLAAVTVVAGTPAVATPVAQGSNTAQLRTLAGKTVRAGDMLGIVGQLVRVMADATADGNGLLSIEMQPRARSTWPAGAAVAWNKPTANFMLKADGVPTSWVPGYAEGASIEFIEAL